MMPADAAKLAAGLVLTVALMAPVAAWPAPDRAVQAATPTVGQGTGVEVTGVLEWTLADDSGPQPALVLPPGLDPWFGWAGAVLPIAWEPGAPDATLIGLPPGCQLQPDPLKCVAVCPPALPCVGAATVTWRLGPSLRSSSRSGPKSSRPPVSNPNEARASGHTHGARP